ncbi:MAG: SgcJ/EcaC family oxidoreductase [Pirellulaceae bacterium]
MKPLRIPLATLVGCLLSCFSHGYADEKEAITETIESYVSAFNRGDAEALAAHWAEDGELVTPSGGDLKGRKAIQEGAAEFFKESPGARLKVDVATITIEGPETAIEQGTAQVTEPNQPATETVYTARYVKKEGKWLLTSIRESLKAPTHHEQLKELEWLIGQWVDQDEDSTVETVCQWTKNKNFISRSFAVSLEDQLELEGTQIIGWDPSQKVIRSWMFDSDGGFGVGLWERSGNQWKIRALRILADGRKASSVNTLTRLDENTFTWKSTGREVDGEILPSIGPVTVTRK